MLLFLLSTALAAPLEPGDQLDQAIGIHLTDAGLAELGNVVEALLPPVIPFRDIEGEIACDENDATPLSYNLADMDLTITAQDVALETSEGRMDIWMFITLASSPSTLDISGDCTFLTGLEETCGVQVPVTAATVHVGIEMGLSEGVFTNTVDAVEFELSPIGNPLDDCTLSDAIGTLLNQNQNALSDIILDLVLPELEGLSTEIEGTLDDGLSALQLDTEIAFGAGSVRLELMPTALNLQDNGLFIGMGSRLTPDALSSCVGEIPTFEALTESWPTLTGEAWSTGLPYDVGLFIGRDFVDFTMYNLWAAGVLCMEIEEIQDAPVNTDLMSVFLGEELDELFPERADAELSITMPTPPTVRFYEDDPVMGLMIETMYLEMGSVLDQRWIRLFQTSMAGEVAIDPGLTKSTLNPRIELPDALFDMDESYSEILSDGYSEGMVELINVLLTTGLLPLDTLPTLTLPNLLGAGVGNVFWLTSEDELWQGGFILLDTQDVEAIVAPGCSGSTGLGCNGESSEVDVFAILGCNGDDPLGCGESAGGCDEEASCEGGGCSTRDGRLQLPLGRWILLAFVAIVFRARRQ